jgi:hypothetical protein
VGSLLLHWAFALALSLFLVRGDLYDLWTLLIRGYLHNLPIPSPSPSASLQLLLFLIVELVGEVALELCQS